MKLCVFQGTFNPIHNAHIRVAKFAYNHKDFDKILFIPAAKPPHKAYNPNLSLHRYNMVKLAIEKYNEFDISDIEFKLQGKSYTYNTICELYKLYPIEEKINFLIGTDAFREIEFWYRTDDLKKLVKFIIFIRDSEFSEKEFSELKEKGYNFEFMPLEFADISSTDIRNRIKENKPVTGLIDNKVEEYIKENGLYKD